MRIRFQRLATAALLAPAALLVPAAALAAVPQGLTEQGRLFDNTGNPLNATVSLTFSLYSAASGGAPLWTETQAAVTLDQGYFSAQLGSVTPIPQSTWTGATLYVGVAVNADPEMSPRQPTYSVPYALMSNDAVGAIHPTTVSVNGSLVIDSEGNWVGAPTGLVGPTGAAGAEGAAGPAGSAGPQGPQGPIGPTGPAGAAGAQGAQGLVGAGGATGAQGPTGIQGATGAQGSAGSNGSNGAPGLAGATGADGAPGATGPAGAQGATGAAGPSGPQGAAGSNGAQGPQGSAGASGATGAQGSGGPEGASGAQGPAGANGSDGAEGPAGAIGATGASGPAGADGATGAAGATGPTGAAGAGGPTGPMGPQGPAGAMGPQGPAGSNGAQGATGTPGAQGATGTAGSNGAQGATGTPGAQGATGVQGPTGATGAQGTAGAAGSNGAQGPAGPTGPQGVTGAQGAAGAAGATGALGPTGPTGPTGASIGWALNGSSLYNTNSNNLVGIGKSSPSTNLDVNGYFIRQIYRSHGEGPNDSTSSGPIATRSLTFTKTQAATAVRVTWQDNLRCIGNANSCEWEIKFDGSSCTNPGALRYDIYIDSEGAGVSINHHRSEANLGTCFGIAAGSHTVQVYVRGTPEPGPAGGGPEGSPYTGFDAAYWSLEAEEVY